MLVLTLLLKLMHIIADVDFWYEATGDANVLTSSITNYENDDYDDDPTDAADEDDHI